MRDNVDSWFPFAIRLRLGIEHMEDLIFVTGCTLVTSWGAVTYPYIAFDAKISLRIRGATFDWHGARPSVAYHNSLQDPRNSRQNQCVFIRGFRAKRVFLWPWPGLRGAAGSHPDKPDNIPEDEIQVTRVPDIPSYRDPLVGMLDYIAEKCPDNYS